MASAAVLRNAGSRRLFSYPALRATAISGPAALPDAPAAAAAAPAQPPPMAGTLWARSMATFTRTWVLLGPDPCGARYFLVLDSFMNSFPSIRAIQYPPIASCDSLCKSDQSVAGSLTWTSAPLGTSITAKPRSLLPLPRFDALANGPA